MLIMIIVVVLVESGGFGRNENALKIFEGMVWFRDTSTTHTR